MAFELYREAWEAELREPSHKLVLLALADMANAERQCWPSHEELASKTGLSRRTVGVAISALISARIIEAKKRFSASAIYSICATTSQMTKRHKCSHVICEAASHHLGNGCASFAQPLPPNQSSNQSQNQSKRTRAKESLESPDIPSDAPAEYAAHLTDLFEHRKSKRKPFTKMAWSATIKKLARFPVHIRIAAIENSIANGWQGVFPENVKSAAPDRKPHQDETKLPSQRY